MTEHTPNTKPATRTRNWTRVALIVSLAANLLIVGALAGVFWKNEKPRGRHLDRASMGLGAYILALPEPAQSDVMSMIGNGSKDRRKFQKHMHQSRQDLITALQAKPFSPETVKTAMSSQRRGAVDRTMMIQNAYLEALLNMSDEERTAHLRRAQEIMKERYKKRRKSTRD